MATQKMASTRWEAFLTELRRSLVAEGIPEVARYDDWELPRSLARTLGVRANPAEIESALADEARTAARLAEAAPEELGVLELLVDVGGRAWMRDLHEMARERMGLDPERTSDAVWRLQERALARILSAYAGYGEGSQIVALLDLTALAVARRVRGISLPPPLVSARAPRPADPTIARDRIAVLAAALHVSLRRNADGRANRADTKRLSARLSLDEPRVASIVEAGIHAGALVERAGGLVPHPEALADVARGALSLDTSPDLAPLAALVPHDRWIAKEALVRVAMPLIAEQTRSRVVPSTRQLALVRLEMVLGDADTLVHDGHTYVRGAPVPPRSGGDGHVTPSFEIMLGPAAELELVATLALAAEPVRVDRVLTLQLTPGSVAAAIGVGLDVQRIDHALSRVAKHPVPENVRTSLHDFARAVRTARVARVWSLECSGPDAAEALARTLTRHVVARPTPTLVLVDGSLDDRMVRAVLARTAVLAADPLPDRALDRRAPLERVAVDLALGDPQLRARFAGARAAGFPDIAVRPTPIATLSRMLREPGAEDADVRRMLELAIELWEQAASPYDAWLDSLSEDVAREARLRAVERPLDAAPWLLLGPRSRDRATAAAQSFDALIEESRRLATTKSAQTKQGRDLVELLQRPRVRASLGVEEGPAAPRAPTSDDEGPMEPEWIPLQKAHEVERALLRAAQHDLPLWLRMRGGSQGERVASLRPEQIVARGRQAVVLGVDGDTDESRSYPLDQILGVSLQLPMDE